MIEIFHRPNLKKGVVLCLFAWACFSAMYAISKGIGAQTNVATMTFFRNVFGFIAVLPWMVKKWPKSTKTHNLKLIILRSITGVLNLVFVFLAVQDISLVDATLLNNTAPLIVPFVVYLWLKTPLTIKIWPASIIGFIGVIVILQPTKFSASIGVLFGLLSGVMLAISLVTTRISTRHESFFTFMFYFMGIGLLLTAPFAIAKWRIDDLWTLVGLLGIGLFSALGQVGLFFGLKEGKARQLAPIAYSSVVFAGLLQWLFWGIVPEPIFYLGLVLIVASGLWIVLEGSPNNK